MSFQIISETASIQGDLPHTYYKKKYFESQRYNNFRAYADDHHFIALDLVGETAVSVPRAPFGSIYGMGSTQDSKRFLNQVFADLQKVGIRSFQINQPPSIYSDFVSPVILEEAGAIIKYEDLNQVIELKDDWQDNIHEMQRRKLKSLEQEGFYFRKMDTSEFKTAHQFLTVCRQAQGLEINITWEQLEQLISKLPGDYHCFGVFRNEKISALCITVNVNAETAYYYLPATSPMFRSHSPMVLLVAGLVDYYRNQNFAYLDLGISSVEGKPQETLILFKERMGAVTLKKPTFTVAL